MDLRQLEYVVAVADCLSFTRAAQQCHVVQSALSHQVQRLETELDTRLFERTSRSVRTTPAGELLVGYARRILATVADARVELDALAGLERGELAIGATQTAGRVLDVIALFGMFNRQHSAIKLTSISGPGAELVDGLRTGSLDLAFVAESARTLGRGLARAWSGRCWSSANRWSRSSESSTGSRGALASGWRNSPRAEALWSSALGPACAPRSMRRSPPSVWRGGSPWS